MAQRKESYVDQLRPGCYLYWQMRRYRVLPNQKQDPLLLHLEDIETQEQLRVRVEEILLNQTGEMQIGSTLAALEAEINQRQQKSIVPNWEMLPAHLQQQAERIINVVETVERQITAEKTQAQQEERSFSRTVALKQACVQLADPIGQTTYYKYWGLYQRYQGDRAALAAGLRRQTFNQSKFSQAEHHFIDIHILRFYARSRFMRPRPSTLYKIVQSTFARTEGMWVSLASCDGQIPEDLVEELLDPTLPFQAIKQNPEKASLLTAISLPSRSWFYQYLRWFEHQPEHGKKIVSARHSVAEWEREQMVFDTYVSRATMPLQYVFADHWLIDLFTVDEATRSQLDRLWLTLLIDAYSRSILGMALLYEAPCLESIQLALRHAIWPKTSHQGLGLEGEWVCYGIPQHLSLDNAWAHHAPSLRNLTRVVSQGGRYNNIELVFRPPYKGRYGAIIERLFGNFSSQMRELFPGAIRGNEPHERRRAAQEACLLYQDMYALIQQMILVYQHTPHQELGQMTPHQKWVEGVQFTPVLVPPLTTTLERQFWRTYPQKRTITSKGIALFGMHYWSSALNHIARRGGDGKPIHFSLSYEPADISRLALFAQDQWLGDVYAKELRLPDGSTRSLSLWECQMAKTMARMQEQTSRNWLSYVDQIDKLSKNRFAERKKGQRLSKGGLTSPTNVRENGAKPSAKLKAQTLEAALEEARLQGDQPDYTDLLVDFVDPKSEEGAVL